MNINNYETELNEIFQEDELVTQIQDDVVWRINDLNAATWADGIVFENEQKIAEIEAVYKQRMDDFKFKMDT